MIEKNEQHSNWCETMQIVKVTKMSDSEIVFNSIKDLEIFFEEVTNGKYVILAFNDGSVIKSELKIPNISPLISDGKITLRSEEKIK